MQAARYRIKSATIALAIQGDRSVATTIPAGAIITVENVGANRLVEVTWDGEKLLMFPQDVRTRGEEIDRILNRDPK